ncbi:MAG: ATPase [Devosia sp.]|uniref:AAA family ATPase n=1 Tax=Devosia sp. TaxID=1871048 RepID=UPI002620E5BA|nr:AAA family ATPase [Devosia sp.]MDB5527545.1 ATPase [Devosia sp.]
MENFVVISGCSSGGKSTLLAELGRRGHTVVEEPGRRIVQQQLQSGGTALPWADTEAFIRRAMAMALADRAAVASHAGLVFFDRGLIDAAAGVERLTGELTLAPLRAAHRYHHRVFLTPPWPEIYVTDPERRHGLAEAEAEYANLLQVYPSLGYEPIILPKISVTERADFIERVLAE